MIRPSYEDKPQAASGKGEAMEPPASVSGFYLAHPQAQYFNVGRVGDDQVQDMAERRNVAVDELRRRLGANL